MYDKEQNKKAAGFLFSLLQLFLLLFTYGFIYTTYIAMKAAIAEHNISRVILGAPLIATLLYPYFLYKGKQLFLAGNPSRGMGMMAAMSVLTIVILYALLAQFV